MHRLYTLRELNCLIALHRFHQFRFLLRHFVRQSELRRVYTQLQVLRNKTMRKDNPVRVG